MGPTTERGSPVKQAAAVAWGQEGIFDYLQQVRQPCVVLKDSTHKRIGVGPQSVSGYESIGYLPPLYPEWLGDRSFGEVHGVRFPYASGAMANGIATTDIVVAMANAGFLGFFGAAGLSLERIEAAIDTIESQTNHGASWGSNLIHNPQEPHLEAAVADLYIRRGVRRVSAAAYMKLTSSVVRYAYSGIYQDSAGQIQRKNYLFAKISRPEVARHFMAPAPEKMLQQLVADGLLTPEEGKLAAQIPVAEDYTVESDSGGHTDNQPMNALLPTILDLREQMVAQYSYSRPIRIGAAGGLGTPQGVAAAFALGAAFVVTGSVNQSCVESGLAVKGKELLAKLTLADVVMAPCADMFEMGVEVQVVKKGSMFGVRSRRLYELYKNYGSLEAIPQAEKLRLEKEILRMSVAEAWEETKAFWLDRNPKEVERADRDPKHRMALVFRAYIGQSSRWAITGDDDRKMDYQIWCGPAMGAFNSWVKGSFLEDPAERSVVQVARNLIEGAAVVTRAQQLRTFGVPVPAKAFSFIPRRLK